MIHQVIPIQKGGKYEKACEEIMAEIWPEAIRASKVVKEYWPQLAACFPGYQLVCLSKAGEIIGFVNTVPFYWEEPLENLPEEGWDWLIEKGVRDYEKGVVPNCLGGLQIGIAKKYQGKGYSKEIIKIGKELLRKEGLSYFVIPIRPTGKHQYPLINMAEYITWERGGKPYDPWISIHKKCGAEIVKVCHKAMVITGTVLEWERWTGLTMQTSGSYIVKGVLHPVEIDVEKNQGIYEEANVWIYYKK